MDNESFMWSIWKDSQAQHWIYQVQSVYSTLLLFALCFAHGMVLYGGRRTDTLGIFWGSRCSDCQFQAMPGEAELLQRSQCTPLLLQPRTLLSVCCFPGNSWICLRNSYFWESVGLTKGFTWPSPRKLCISRWNCRLVSLPQSAGNLFPLSKINSFKKMTFYFPWAQLVETKLAF